MRTHPGDRTAADLAPVEPRQGNSFVVHATSVAIVACTTSADRGAWGA